MDLAEWSDQKRTGTGLENGMSSMELFARRLSLRARRKEIELSEGLMWKMDSMQKVMW